jgi:molybdopterin-containing oxidoreductase family iron-sulfur binding subunit
MTRWGMVIDQNRCVGCYACTVACKVENATPKGIWYAPVYEKEVGHYPIAKRVFLPTLCNHCEDAPCLQACPTQAISRRPDGIVLVDEDKCCGSRACVAACPYGAMHFFEEAGGEFGEELTPLEQLFAGKYQKGTVQKCTFCAHRIDAGVPVPACVEACPTSCRIFGDLEDPDSNISHYIRRKNAHQPNPDAGTNPSVWYVS